MPIIPLPIQISGEWAKPVNTLLERIFGIIERKRLPAQIVKEAEAEAKAAVIKASAQAECDEIRMRSWKWFVAEQELHQLNREEIVRGALPLVREDARPSEIEEDWIIHFFGFVYWV